MLAVDLGRLIAHQAQEDRVGVFYAAIGTELYDGLGAIERLYDIAGGKPALNPAEHDGSLSGQQEWVEAVWQGPGGLLLSGIERNRRRSTPSAWLWLG